jgi:predicted dehydrogenase/threonine dehydrogenase-like Zn-dependent dehydrogenase
VKQVLVRGGSVLVQQVPAPEVSQKNILVRVTHSCISVGTEMAGVKMSGLPLYRRALKQPHHVKKVLQVMRDQGVKRTWDRVTGQLAAGLPTGYSAAGEVISVGDQVDGFRAGDLVACAGAGVANHAELIDVPVNLAVKVPAGVSTELASTVTLGAIALQGVRRAAPTLGESFVVIGLGLLGQITAQLLRATGIRVIGVDLAPERVKLALENGMYCGINPAEEDFVARVQKLTDGFGADAAIVTAATPSHEVIAQAMQSCRKKGRVVLVGDVGLNLDRNDLYKKELDFLVSCSYGPGRYDPSYEDSGQDYPLPYVRWTENRNMEEYLRLVQEGRISLANLQPKVFPIDSAEEAYESLKKPGQKPLLAILSYPFTETALQRTIPTQTTPRRNSRSIGVALVGAGGFAQAMHLPNMMKLGADFSLRCIMSRTGANALAAANQYQAGYATTEFEKVLNDEEVDLVLISTRHHLHGQMVLEALRAGKNVFVEKPLTIYQDEVTAIEDFYLRNNAAPLLMTGFNRRFSPAAVRTREVLAGRTTPIIVNYRMNAGYIALDHWVHGEEGGGRNLGEACHIYDLFNFLTGAESLMIAAQAIVPVSRQWKRNDNFVANISYADGSVCSLTYTALGDKTFPKESMDIFADGKVISLNDYKQLTIFGSKQRGWKSITQEKGQLEELKSLADCLLRGKEWPIPLSQQLQATRNAFEVEQQITAEILAAATE